MKAGWRWGVSHLCRLTWEAPGSARPCSEGWHLVKYSREEIRASLSGFGPNELQRLREEFGLLTDAELGRWSGEPAFYASRAWAGLVQWVAAHPQLARRYAHRQAYLAGWYDHVQQATPA
jgi:hypothetical protein